MSEIEFIKNLVSKYNEYYNNEIIIENIEQNSGGKIRTKNGILVESIAKEIIIDICYYLDIDFIIGGQKREKIKVLSNNGSINVSTDVHLIINEKKVLFIECKTYLDKCYLDRANSDMYYLKSQYPDSYTCVLSLENATSENVLNFFIDQGNIDNIFFLLDGKRNAKQPIWNKEYKKGINISLLEKYIYSIYQIIKQYR